MFSLQSSQRIAQLWCNKCQKLWDTFTWEDWNEATDVERPIAVAKFELDKKEEIVCSLVIDKMTRSRKLAFVNIFAISFFCCKFDHENGNSCLQDSFFLLVFRNVHA